MTFDEWIKAGIEHGYCGPPVCYTHDEFDENDPCLHIIRLYENTEHKISIERDHAPSQWRNLWTTGN
jgi:hypothetical protein